MKANSMIFPLSHDKCYDTGITARDYIAIQAMVGLSANPELNDRELDEIAVIAYKQADAMLKRSEMHE